MDKIKSTLRWLDFLMHDWEYSIDRLPGSLVAWERRKCKICKAEQERAKVLTIVGLDKGEWYPKVKRCVK